MTNGTKSSLTKAKSHRRRNIIPEIVGKVKEFLVEIDSYEERKATLKATLRCVRDGLLKANEKNYARAEQYNKKNANAGASEDVSDDEGENGEEVSINPGDLGRVLLPDPIQLRESEVELGTVGAQSGNLPHLDQKDCNMKNMRTESFGKRGRNNKKMKGEEIHAVLYCSHCGTIWARDVGGARGVGYVKMEELQTGLRPWGYCYQKPAGEKDGISGGRTDGKPKAKPKGKGVAGTSKGKGKGNKGRATTKAQPQEQISQEVTEELRGKRLTRNFVK
ncbi:hypothetical protein HK097_006923 [Rhizophlyctis rosea]|uniref:Uncharacterized protein n=1 Tax=Rhizophlyctis rosea TaxID=64517 RepID=A0AAD5SQM8_9FUNG|nr:hypothetical protein HK097_006923 [Rhizophlyctis rosea]